MSISRCVHAFALLLACVAPMAAQTSTNSIVAELRSGEPAEALRDVVPALQAAPRDAGLWTLKGLAERQLAHSGEALQSFQKALAIDAQYVPALEGVCELLYADEPAKAAPYVKRLLDRLPDEPNANGMAAILAYRSGNYAVAANHFVKAGSVIVNSQQGMDAYADTLARLQRQEDCERTLAALLQQWPADSWARYNLAALQYRRGANPAALETLQPLLERNDGPGLALAAALHESAGDTPAAVELLRRAIAADPKEPQNYVDFATISFDHNSPRAGIAMVDAGLEQLPEAAALYAARGILLMQIADIAGGERDFAEANRLDPSQSFGREAQGVATIQQHNLPKALEQVKNSLVLAPRSAYLNYMAAQILKVEAVPGTTQADECLTYARRAVLLDPKLVGAWDIVAGQEFSAGHFAESAEAARAAHHLDPSDQEAVFRLMMIARRSGNSHEVASLVEQLKALKARDHRDEQRGDRYRLLGPGEAQSATSH